MVVGEMAPKSWAIAHPERSAVLLALPFRGFAWVMRPALSLLNAMANGCLRLVGVTPQDELGQVHGPKELQLLIASSKDHGMLAEPEHRVLAGAIDLDTTPLTDVVVPIDERRRRRHDRHLRRGRGASRATPAARGSSSARATTPVGIAHVRDIVRAAPGRPSRPSRRRRSTSTPGSPCSTPCRRCGPSTPSSSSSTAPTGPVGLVTMEDLLERVLGRFDDETDA